jgi:cardiolipin synthase
LVVRDRDFNARLSAEIEAAIAESREVSREDAGGRMALLRRGLVAWLARVFLRVAGATGRY